MSLLVDRVMSEAGLYSKPLRRAGAQAVRGLERTRRCSCYALIAPPSSAATIRAWWQTRRNMRHGSRRISAAFKDIPGGQILGATYDYTHRLMNF